MARLPKRRNGRRREPEGRLAGGSWWRAARYEFTPGPRGPIIAPAERARPLPVDPWADWSPVESRRRDTTIGAELASLGHFYGEIVDDDHPIPGAVLSEPAVAGILAFVGRWGLLGTALAETAWVRSHGELVWFAGGQWQSRLIRPGEPTTFAVERLTVAGPVVDEDPAWWCEHASPRQVRGEWRAGLYLMPSDQWIESYSEPVGEFLLAASRLERALEALRAGDVFAANLLLGRMASHVTPVVERGAVQRWACGSLLETIALQTMMDADRRPLLRCAGCGRWFRILTGHRTTTWCSERCQKNAPRRTGRPTGRPRKERA